MNKLGLHIAKYGGNNPGGGGVGMDADDSMMRNDKGEDIGLFNDPGKEMDKNLVSKKVVNWFRKKTM